MIYKKVLKPIFFQFDPETIHYKVFNWLKWGMKFPFVKPITKVFFTYKSEGLSKSVFGLDFPNPVGLAAGFDKDAKLYRELFALGFGFVEVGTVTPKPQEGNPKPRLFRLPEDEALINRMGFNNEGVEAMIQRLKNRPKNCIIGGNIGKNKITPNEAAVDDYLVSFEALFPYVDYFVVNVSSPNTPDLRDLQEKEPLLALLKALQARNKEQKETKPILLKIAPDLTEGQLDDIIEIIESTKIAGLIATNTTISRDGLKTSAGKIEEIGNGGLSGKPVKDKSLEVIKYLRKNAKKHFPIIAVGGIHSAEDALEKWKAGADLLQLYTGFIYEGPSLVKKINKAIAAYERAGKNN